MFVFSGGFFGVFFPERSFHFMSSRAGGGKVWKEQERDV